MGSKLGKIFAWLRGSQTSRGRASLEIRNVHAQAVAASRDTMPVMMNFQDMPRSR